MSYFEDYKKIRIESVEFHNGWTTEILVSVSISGDYSPASVGTVEESFPAESEIDERIETEILIDPYDSDGNEVVGYKYTKEDWAEIEKVAADVVHGYKNTNHGYVCEVA